MSAVRLKHDEAGLAVASFDKPPLNLFDREMFEGLQAAVAAVEAEPPRACCSAPRAAPSRAA